jgi:dedicator of cytokinesis protein 3
VRADPRQSLTAVAKSNPHPTGMFYHLLLDFRAFIASPCAPGETAELYFSLYSKTYSQFITEEYCLVLNHLGSPARDAEQRLGRLRTLFTELKGDEVSGQIFLVCRLIRNGAMHTRLEASSSGSRSSHSDAASRRPSSVLPTGTYLSPHTADTIRSKTSVASIATDDSWSITSAFGGHRTNTVDTSYTATPSIVDGRPSFRRPLGCAVLELPKPNKLLSDGGEKGGMEFSIPIFAPGTEEAFATLHEDIIFGRMKDVATSPR